MNFTRFFFFFLLHCTFYRVVYIVELHFELFLLLRDMLCSFLMSEVYKHFKVSPHVYTVKESSVMVKESSVI